MIGLDPSLTSFGVSCLAKVSDGKPSAFSFPTKSTDGSDIQRELHLYSLTIDYIKNAGNVVLVAIEDYGPINRMAGKITQRAELIGMLKRHLLVECNIPFITIIPTQLKKYATGNAHAKKDAMMQHAAADGLFVNNSDEADAYFLAKLARLVANGDKATVGYQLHKP